MNKNSMRIAACALAGTFVLSGYNSSLNAQVSNSTNLPAAGIAVVLEEGTTIQELTKEGIRSLAPTVITMAEAEELTAHAEAARVRMA